MLFIAVVAAVRGCSVSLASECMVSLFLTLLFVVVKDSYEDHSEKDHEDKVDRVKDPDIIGDPISAFGPYNFILIDKFARLFDKACG